LRARGATGVDLSWKNGRALETVLRSDQGGEQIIRAPKGQQIAAISRGGTPVDFYFKNDGTALLSTAAGGEYRITFK
jgi:hypothetical protein